jgi:hypothetical protein
MTGLLVLAIAASSALVFSNREELLKLAVILALWAAVVAAFVSVIYRRQSDIDQARARDLKLVYDLQLDREISARREYELTVESQLRQELASEQRVQAADEVAALRAELAALRTNLEILFDTDLEHRPALEIERTTVRAYSDWARDAETTTTFDRVPSNRVDSVRPDEDDTTRTAENPIIDVPEEPLVPSCGPQVDDDAYRGSHRRPSEDAGWLQQEWPAPQPQPRPEPQPEPEPEPVAQYAASVQQPQPDAQWQPVGPEGQWLPPGAPGSNWVAAPTDNGAEPRRARHYGPPEPFTPHARHRSADDEAAADGQQTGGQSVAELLARLQPGTTGGGGRED